MTLNCNIVTEVVKLHHSEYIVCKQLIGGKSHTSTN